MPSLLHLDHSWSIGAQCHSYAPNTMLKGNLWLQKAFRRGRPVRSRHVVSIKQPGAGFLLTVHSTTHLIPISQPAKTLWHSVAPKHTMSFLTLFFIGIYAFAPSITAIPYSNFALDALTERDVCHKDQQRKYIHVVPSSTYTADDDAA